MRVHGWLGLILDPNVAVYVDDVYLPRAINGMTDLTGIAEFMTQPQPAILTGKVS